MRRHSDVHLSNTDGIRLGDFECNGDVTTVTLPLGPKSYRLILRELVRKVYSRCRLSSEKGDSKLETCQRRLLRSQVL